MKKLTAGDVVILKGYNNEDFSEEAARIVSNDDVLMVAVNPIDFNDDGLREVTPDQVLGLASDTPLACGSCDVKAIQQVDSELLICPACGSPNL